MNATTYYTKLAKKHALPLVQLDIDDIDISMINIKHRIDYLTLQAIPISQTATTIKIATADPNTDNQQNIKDFFSKKFKKNIKIVISSIKDITQILAQCFKKSDTNYITNTRKMLDRFHSASHTFSLMEKIVLFTLVCLTTVGALANFFITALWINVFLASGTLVLMAYKMGLTIHALRFLTLKPKGKPEVLQEYPSYTVLIPLLDEEKATITLLLEALNRLDYPNDKLDIKFLLEEHDTKTASVLHQFSLPWHYQILIVPAGTPQSKPRACNYGLCYALGQYLTIYDAEDRPDPDQLKIALHHFNTSSPEVVCLQAALNYYNYRENILTRLFTIEYTHWFDSLIPALDSLHVPVPLGGTSNHFNVKILRKVGGWDPFVGTEDAEIGVRLYRYGYRVESIRSTTYEEANTSIVNWFKQRTRWNKGYMQTYLVNMRDPINMAKTLGIWRFINFQFFVGGNVFYQLANLPLWIFLFSTLFFYNEQIENLYPKTLLVLCWYNFIISNIILMLAEFVATYRRRLYCLLPYVPLKIFYWLLMSFAGYYAIIELLVRPGYWYKTKHNLSHEGRHTDVPLTRQSKTPKSRDKDK